MITSIFSRSITVRNAKPKDCEFVGQMISQINKLVLGKGDLPSNFNDKYNEMLKNPKQYSIFVAEDKDKDNKIIKLGAAITTTQLLLMTCEPYLYVQDLVVNEEARGKGVGSAIIQHIVQYCKKNNIFFIDLVQPPDSDIYHEKRTKFYSSLGFEIGGRNRFFDH